MAGLLTSLGCRPRVPAVPDAVQRIAVAPPSQARAAVIEGWHGLARGDLEAAEGAARRALQLDPGSAEPMRLAAAVSRASGAPERARAELDAALATDPDCGACWRDRVALTGRDADAASAIRAGVAPLAVLDRLPGPPGPAALAAWAERTDLDADARAARGLAWLESGDPDAARTDLLGAVAEGTAEAAVIDALVEVGEPLVAIWAARHRGQQAGAGADAVQAWFRLAWRHGTPAEQAAASAALGALPAALLEGSTPGSVREAVDAGASPRALPAPAAWRMLAEGTPGDDAHALEALPGPEGPAEVAAWLLAAAALDEDAEAVVDRARSESALARVVVEHALQRGDASLAAELAPRGWDGGTPRGVAGWPRRLEALAAPGVAAGLRATATPVGAVAIAVAEQAPDAVSRVSALGSAAAHLAPAALLDAGQPCAAAAAVQRVSPDRLGDVPRLGDVGYGAWTAGCWPDDTPAWLRRAQALVPADGRVAHVLGLALAASGDVATAQALLAQARWALPRDAALQSDLVRIHDLTEEHR